MLPNRTTKRPVPLEHCLFYSGELYKVCENDMFLPQGFRAAKDAYKKKNSNTLGAKSAARTVPTGPGSTAQVRQSDNSSRGRGQKYPKHQTIDSGTTGVHQNSSGSKRSDASSWLLLVNKLSKMSLLPVRKKHSF